MSDKEKENQKEQGLNKTLDLKIPNKEKAYPVRNFFKELKRVSWSPKKNNYKYFFWVFVFIIVLIILFAAVSWVASEIIKLIGAN